MAAPRMPALSLAAVPGRRQATLELAREIERHGFAGIYGPSLGDNLSLCLSLAHTTRDIPFGTTIKPIYTRHVEDFAQTAAYLHEVSGGRFWFGVGVSHGPVHERLSLQVGKPLDDIRRFVTELRAVERVGELPPIVLAGLRDKMVALAAEIAEGVVWANGALSLMEHSVGVLGKRAREDGFFVGNMIPTVVSEDETAATQRNRRTLVGYAALPNYRNYWKAAGYVEEMEAVERALAAKDPAAVEAALSDRWLSDVTLYGPARKIRDRVEAWFDAGVKTPILVPSSATGRQMEAFQELFAAYR